MSLILMRHAEAQHNILKKQIKSKAQQSSVKNLQEYISSKRCPSFHDTLITSKGYSEAELAGSMIDWENVELILVSPMKRCLQTCRRVLSKTQKQIQVKILPILKGRLSGAWDFGSPLTDLSACFPEYNFDHLKEESQIPWYIKTICKTKQNLFLNLKQAQLCQFEHLEQDYVEFRMRVEKVRQVLVENSKKLDVGKKMLVITHSCILKTLLAQQFDHRGKGKCGLKFQNAKPIQLKLTRLLKGIKQQKWIQTKTEEIETEQLCQ